MIAADRAQQRTPQSKLLVVDKHGGLLHVPRSRFIDFLRPGDVLIANDAATLPASLHGIHRRTSASIEVRLAARRSLAIDDVVHFTAVIFGAGDFHTRTEDRALPPTLAAGDKLTLGPLDATVERLLGHPRLIALRFEGRPDMIWAGLARHGRAIQYAHIVAPLQLWDVWTPIAGPAAAFEPPSAGFALSWQLLTAMHTRGIAFVTLTHAAGISSTGDPELDRRLPFDEAYRISEATVSAIHRARKRGGRVVAVGTTVVRAIEHAAAREGAVRAGEGVATQRIDAASRLRAVDAILSGTHETGTSHHELLHAFIDEETALRVGRELDTHGYRTHEFGDSVLIERRARIVDQVKALPASLALPTAHAPLAGIVSSEAGAVTANSGSALHAAASASRFG